MHEPFLNKRSDQTNFFSGISKSMQIYLDPAKIYLFKVNYRKRCQTINVMQFCVEIFFLEKNRKRVSNYSRQKASSKIDPFFRT